METYELTQERVGEMERGPLDWKEQFWVDVFMELLDPQT